MKSSASCSLRLGAPTLCETCGLTPAHDPHPPSQPPLPHPLARQQQPASRVVGAHGAEHPTVQAHRHHSPRRRAAGDHRLPVRRHPYDVEPRAPGRSLRRRGGGGRTRRGTAIMGQPGPGRGRGHSRGRSAQRVDRPLQSESHRAEHRQPQRIQQPEPRQPRPDPAARPRGVQPIGPLATRPLSDNAPPPSPCRGTPSRRIRCRSGSPGSAPPRRPAGTIATTAAPRPARS